MADEHPEGTTEETKPVEETSTTDQGDGATTDPVDEGSALDQ
jgi:hypothetical protein